MEEEVDDSGINNEGGKENEQNAFALYQAAGFETNIKARQHCGGGHKEIVRYDQRFARAGKKSEHSRLPYWLSIPCLPIPGFGPQRYPAPWRDVARKNAVAEPVIAHFRLPGQSRLADIGPGTP